MPAVAPGPTPYYGRRYNPATGQMDSQDMKSTGWLGPSTNALGQNVSEYGFTAPIDGREVEVPSIVPGLTGDQLRAVLAASAGHGPPPRDVMDAAYEHARGRIGAGLSPFWNPAQDGWPRR